jgi:hypothetical protein
MLRARSIPWLIVAVAPLAAAAHASSGCGTTGSGESGAAGGPPDDGGVIVVLDGGGGPILPPEGEELCPVGVCNYQSGGGCSEPTPSCVPALLPNGDIVPSCQPAGTGKTGDFCEAWTDCAPGYVCFGKGCRKLCCGGDWTGCPSENEHCFNVVTFDGLTPTGAMLCHDVNTCDPLVPGSCTQLGKTCQLVDPTGAAACVPENTGGAGDPCPCQGGFLCVAEKCRRLCKAVEGGGEPYCQAGEGRCVHFDRDPPGVGECTP